MRKTIGVACGIGGCLTGSIAVFRGEPWAVLAIAISAFTLGVNFAWTYPMHAAHPEDVGLSTPARPNDN